MKAVVYSAFNEQPVLQDVPEPSASEGGVVIKVEACGVCRSDYHGWTGNDPDITLPHVPGHELAGVIAEVGEGVREWAPGDRVTVPFVCGCGECVQCASGNQQVCDRQFQPGFTHAGAFAEKVFVAYADTNLVALDDEIPPVTAASLGCRFSTAFRAVVDQGRVAAGDRVAVFGCGGVGLAAIMIASAFGADTVGIDIDERKLRIATEVGAGGVLNSGAESDPVSAVRNLTGGGADISIDAVGSPEVIHQSISSLQKRGRHVQVGILEAGKKSADVPFDLVVANELEIRGSHGMQAHRYPEMIAMIGEGKLRPEALVTKRIALSESIEELTGMRSFESVGVTVIDRFTQ